MIRTGYTGGLMDNREFLKHIRLFRKKANTDKLIIFVGAGVSRNVTGMPDWNTLIQQMAGAINYSRCDNCKKKSKSCQDTCKFKDTFSADEYLKVPQYVYNRNKKLYRQVLRDNIQHDLAIDAPLSNAILDLVPAHIITTNYDKLIEICKSIHRDNYEVIIHDKDLLSAAKNKYIIKMHGDIDDLDTIVLKEADYLEYTQKHVLIEMFIRSLLTDHTILFLGYSLNDYNVKLIISWINYIRTQNKALDKATKFAYIVLDEKKITKTQIKYFESNNIGVINLNKMPLVEGIPSDLSSDIGKRLYSFLRVIENPSFEKIFDANILFDDAISFMRKYKYVDCKNICALLFLKQYHIDGHELILHLNSEYDRVVMFLKKDTEDAEYLRQVFFDAGILYVRLVSVHTQRREDYKIEASDLSLANDKLFVAYLENNYTQLSYLANTNSATSPFESCFYMSLIRGYVSPVFEWLDSIQYGTLPTEGKVQYLFNESVLEATKSYRHSSQNILKFINGLSDEREKKMLSLYLDIFEGNYRRLKELGDAIAKLKDQYYNSHHTFLGNISLNELYKIRKIALEQYQFYFKNALLFKGFSDLSKILKYYIEAIICTNGNFIDTTTGAFGITSKKNRYSINAIDFDILTKFISTKDLYKLIQDYSVTTFSVTQGTIEHAVTVFENIANSVIQLKLYNRFLDASKTLMNCITLLPRFSLDVAQKEKIATIIVKLFEDEGFIEFFFSIHFPDFRQSTAALHEILKIIPKRHDLDIIDRILHSKDFFNFYANSNVRKLQDIVSYFWDDTAPEAVDEKVNTIIMSFEGKERVAALRLLYKRIGNFKNVGEYKGFLKDNFTLVNSDDIFDFTFDGWLDISEENSQKILTDAISIYEKQKASAVQSYPDPLHSQVELICILYITETIQSIECLREIMDASEFLQFFLAPNDFDYRQVDFSNYMWENIARRERFMEFFLSHKSDVIPNLQKKIDTDEATEFERKILYGFLLDKNEML